MADDIQRAKAQREIANAVIRIDEAMGWLEDAAHRYHGDGELYAVIYALDKAAQRAKDRAATLS